MEEEEGPGVPEWVVTYGDMMSLLLTFFIMLVSLSEVVADQKYRAVLEALQQYSGYRGAPIAPVGDNYPLNSVMEKLTTLGSQTDDDVGFGGVRKQSIEGNDARVFRTREGKALKVGNSVIFTSDSIIMSPEQRIEVASIAKQLAGKPNKIEIRGHVSSTPLPAGSRWKNKTELSYHRARVVYTALIALKVNVNRLRIGAAGDREPIPQKKTTEENHRVDVLILDAFTNDFIGPRKLK